MRRMILPLSLFVAAACQPATMELTEEQKAAIADTVRQLQLGHYAAAERQDVTALVDNFAEDAVVASNGVLMGHDEFAAFAANLHGGIQALAMTVHDTHIDVLALDVAVVTVLASAKITDTAGVVVAEQMPVAHTHVWVRRNGSWKTLHGHESFATPMQ